MTKVTIQPNNIVFEVEAGETILEAAEKHGIDFPYRCRNGVCTACVCKHLDGKVSYGDRDENTLALNSSQGNRYAYACIGYPLTDLLLHHPFIK
jgi:ferredoxin